MSSYYIKDLTAHAADTTDYPGLRYDGTNADAAVAAYIAANNPAPGTRLRVDPNAGVTWYTVQAQPPAVGVSGSAPTPPAVGS